VKFREGRSCSYPVTLPGATPLLQLLMIMMASIMT